MDIKYYAKNTKDLFALDTIPITSVLAVLHLDLKADADVIAVVRECLYREYGRDSRKKLHDMINAICDRYEINYGDQIQPQ